MTFNFKLPDIGEGVAEGEITRWLVKEGDLVKEDQPMVEVMTDKATVEITSPKSGRIQKILFPEGSVAPVHEVIVVIEEEAGGGAPAAPRPAAPAPARAPAPAAAPPPAPPAPPPRKEQPAPVARPPARPATQPQPAPRSEERRTTNQEAVEEVPTRAAPPEQAHAPTELTPFARASLPPPSAAPRSSASASAATTTTATTAVDDGASDRVLATPATRSLARQLGVDLARVHGTGPRGRVLKADVQAAAAGGSRQPAAAAAPAATPAAPHELPEVHPVARYQAPAAGPAPAGGEERIPYRGLRRAIGEQMVRSFFTAPHFTLVDEVDFTEVDAIRKLAKNDAEASGAKLTYLPFVMKALCAAIRKYPTINASLDEEKGELVVKHDVHIGFALDTERGLMVPVVKNAAHRGLLSIASEITRLSELGRAGKASRDDLTGSTITISSAGNIGGAFATPIINHPEVAIIGVYQVSDKPVVREGQIVIRKMGFLSITLDHRVVDGGTAARVLGEMKRLLGSPGLLLLGD